MANRRLGQWSFDCAQFVQVAELYALRHALGAKEFDRRAARKHFDIRVQWSSGVVSKTIWARERPNGPMTRGESHQPERRTIAQLLARTPFGSRVACTNLAAPEDSVFRNENAVKMGDDQYAALGFLKGRTRFSQVDIEFMLARLTDRKRANDADYRKANIFVSRIEQYDTP